MIWPQPFIVLQPQITHVNSCTLFTGVNISKHFVISTVVPNKGTKADSRMDLNMHVLVAAILLCYSLKIQM
jgi:hypothetical protein